MSNKWTKVRKFVASHRLWKNNENGQFYIADESGDGMRGQIGTPDMTEDGPLRINTMRPIRVSWSKGLGSCISLPVIEEHKDGREEESSTPATVGEMLYLSASFGWPIESEDGFIHSAGMTPVPELEEELV